MAALDTNILVVVPDDLTAYLRRKELFEIVGRLMDKRIAQATTTTASSTVVANSGTSFGTAAKMVADAKLIQAEMDKVAPL